MQKIFLIIVLILFPGHVRADSKDLEVSQVWGRVVKLEEKQAFHGYRYFAYYIKDKKEYAYPIEIKTPQQEKMISTHINKLAKISGSVHSVKIESDGAAMTIVYFSPKSISPLSLSQLGTTCAQITHKKVTGEVSPQEGSAGGIAISDKVANYAIFAAGSLLIGSILKDYIHKK